MRSMIFPVMVQPHGSAQKPISVFTLGLLIAAPDPVNLARGWISNQLIVAHVEIFAHVKHHRTIDYQIIADRSKALQTSTTLDQPEVLASVVPGGYGGKITCRL